MRRLTTYVPKPICKSDWNDNSALPCPGFPAVRHSMIECIFIHSDAVKKKQSSIDPSIGFGIPSNSSDAEAMQCASFQALDKRHNKKERRCA